MFLMPLQAEAAVGVQGGERPSLCAAGMHSPHAAIPQVCVALRH